MNFRSNLPFFVRAVSSQLGSNSRSKLLYSPFRHYSKIYTRTGDKGKSSTFTGERRSKDDIIFTALGNTDELNSAIGLAAEFCKDAGLPLDQKLHLIQCALLDVGSIIATPESSARPAHLMRVAFDPELVQQLETWIDDMTQQLPPLKNFILPSGGKSAASLHLARSICRRAERSIVPLVRDQEINNDTLKFINRLSDFLFTAARFVAMQEGTEEVIYKKPSHSNTDSHSSSGKDGS